MEGIIGEKSEGFAGTIIKDTWTITRGVETGEGGGVGWLVRRGRGKGRKLYLNKNKNEKKEELVHIYNEILLGHQK